MSRAVEGNTLIKAPPPCPAPVWGGVAFWPWGGREVIAVNLKSYPFVELKVCQVAPMTVCWISGMPCDWRTTVAALCAVELS